MPRRPRVAPGGIVYHVLNRAVGRMHMFRSDADFQAFVRVVAEAHKRVPIRILAYCVLSNHWHFVVWPRKDGELTAFFRWLAHTHAMRWRVAHDTVGYGHLYQGRFKSFPVQEGGHLLSVCRYVERNALSAGLVKRAEQWRWSSLWTRSNGDDAAKVLLSQWPAEPPADWIARVNEPLSEKEHLRLSESVRRGKPFGDDRWVERSARQLQLQQTLRSEGRPRKTPMPTRRPGRKN